MSTFCDHWRVSWSAVHRSQLARGEQPGQLRVDAGEALLRVGSGVAGGAAEGRRRGEEALGVLGRGEVVAVVGDDELEAQLIGRGGGQGGAPPPASAPSSPSPVPCACSPSMVSS